MPSWFWLDADGVGRRHALALERSHAAADPTLVCDAARYDDQTAIGDSFRGRADAWINGRDHAQVLLVGPAGQLRWRSGSAPAPRLPDGAAWHAGPSSEVRISWYPQDDTEMLPLARHLYEHLYRPMTQALAWGPAVPVRLGQSPSALLDAEPRDGTLAPATEDDLLDASRHIVVLLLGFGRFAAGGAEEVDAQVTELYHRLGPGRLIVVPLHAQWRHHEARWAGLMPLVRPLYDPQSRPSAEEVRRDILTREVLLAVCAAMAPPVDLSSAVLAPGKAARPRIFLSHAKSDLSSSGRLAWRLHELLLTRSSVRSFFDETELMAGWSIGDALDEATASCVFVLVRTEAYASRTWCQRELLHAKRSGVPMVIVDVLARDVPRSLSFEGNAPVLCWRGDADFDLQAEALIRRASQAWLAHLYFRLDAEAVVRRRGWAARPVVFSRPPEAVDVAFLDARHHQGTVLYPDPPLSRVELAPLRALAPDIAWVTPSTWLATGPQESAVPSVSGLRVAISMSAALMADGTSAEAPDRVSGLSPRHLESAASVITQALLGAGARVAYGGAAPYDVIDHGSQTNFSAWLAQAVTAWSDLGADNTAPLLWYLDADEPVDGSQLLPPLELRRVDAPVDASIDPRLGPVSMSVMTAVGARSKRVKTALRLTALRQCMTSETHARIVLGGTVADDGGPTAPSTAGLFPGVVEEAYWSLVAGKPLYVVGGFGGQAGLVAAAMLGRMRRKAAAPREDDAEEWPARRAAWHGIASAHPDLAADLDCMFEAFQARGSALGLTGPAQAPPPEAGDGAAHAAPDAMSLAFNGLNVAENLQLLTSRHPPLIAALILRGLTRCRRSEAMAGEDLRVLVLPGGLTTARKAQVWVLLRFRGDPSLGSAAEVERLLSSDALPAFNGTGLQRPMPIHRPDLAVRELRILDLEGQTATDREAATVSGIGQALQMLPAGTSEVAISLDFGLGAVGPKAITSALPAWLRDAAQARVRTLTLCDRHAPVGLFRALASRADLRAQVEILDPRELPEVSERFDLLTLSTTGRGHRSVRAALVDHERGLGVHVEAGGGPDVSAWTDVGSLSWRVHAERVITTAHDQFGRLLPQLRRSERPLVVLHERRFLPVFVEPLADPEGRLPPLGVSRVIAHRSVGLRSRSKTGPRAPRPNGPSITIVTQAGDPDIAEPLAAHGQRLVDAFRERRHDVYGPVFPDAASIRKQTRETDVLYLCCHGRVDGNAALLQTHAGEPFRPNRLFRGRVPAVVFLNACEAGRTAVGPLPESFVDQLRRLGAWAVIGSCWQLPTEQALPFAECFFRHWLQGATTGEAMLGARRERWHNNPTDAVWASWLLFGAHDLRLAHLSAR